MKITLSGNKHLDQSQQTDTQIIQSESWSEYMWRENTGRTSVKQHKAQPRSQGSLLPALGENPGNEVA